MGVYGLNCRFKLTSQVMDTRLRGDDKIGIGQLPNPAEYARRKAAQILVSPACNEP